jgi:DNA-binding response OmpR family regulator
MSDRRRAGNTPLRVAKDPPARMVLDLIRPELYGYEVCRRVRATSDLPIIMVTARDDDVDKSLVWNWARMIT